MINIAELLKDAPKGLELYSPLFGKVKFLAVDSADSTIIVETERETHEWFSAHGKYKVIKSHMLYSDAECLLFPSKECRTWEEWKVDTCRFKVLDWIVRKNGSSDVPIQVYDLKKDRYLVTNILGSKGEVMLTHQDKWRLWTIQDAKDGDVLVSRNDNPFIYNGNIEFSAAGAYVGISQDGKIRLDMFPSKGWTNIKDVKPATKEQYDLLFQKIKEIGYEWDKKKKELRKIIKPKFKVGDWITNGTFTHYIVSIVDGFYYFYGGGYLDFGKIDGYYHLWTVADAKDGDVLARNWHEDGDSWEKIIIFKNYHTKGVKGLFKNPCVEGYGNTFKNGKLAFNEEVPYYSKTWTDNLQPANTKQRDLLFQKMKENGYEWDFEKKDLKKIQPHYDIKNFHAGMPVLVRDSNKHKWKYVVFSHNEDKSSWGYKFNAAGTVWQQCIPFDGNKHLLGTSDPCDEQYINW